MPRNTLAGAPTEKAITKRIRDYMTSVAECVVYKQHGSAYALPGTPDFIGCYRGRFFAVEVKRPHSSSRLRPEQKRELDKINAAGGFGIVARERQDVVNLFRYIDSTHEFVAGVPDYNSVKGY